MSGRDGGLENDLIAAIRARKRTLVHHRAETLHAEKIGALSSDPSPVSLDVELFPSIYSVVYYYRYLRRKLDSLFR